MAYEFTSEIPELKGKDFSATTYERIAKEFPNNNKGNDSLLQLLYL